MRKILILILILLPGFEIAGLIYLFSHYGWWFFIYLITMAVLGWQLINEQKSLVLPRLLTLISQGGNPMGLIMGAAKSLLAGALFLFPGIITDIIALFLLLLPAHEKKDGEKYDFNQKTNNKDKSTSTVIEGEYHREEESEKK